jgi:hypothetical protein
MNFFEKLLSYKLCNKAKTVFWWSLVFFILAILGMPFVGVVMKAQGKSKIKTTLSLEFIIGHVAIPLFSIWLAESTCTNKNLPDIPSWLIIIFMLIIQQVFTTVLRKGLQPSILVGNP